jgi:ubiquinone/menaquinone biosynthesis C-methylase UbiE
VAAFGGFGSTASALQKGTVMREVLRSFGRIVRLLLTPDPVKRTGRYYGLVAPMSGGQESRYLNVGYWEHGVTNSQEAGERLATRLADAAGFKPDDTVLDVGAGYGRQDLRWLQERRIRKVYAVDATPHHVDAAQRHAALEGFADRTEFRVGNATQLQFEDGIFDCVVALDSAFHFHPRSAFFAEAYRVLRAGGVLATADVIPLSGDTRRQSLRSKRFSMYRFTVPDANWHDRGEYEKQLLHAGFVDPIVTSIRDRVWDGWYDYELTLMDGWKRSLANGRNSVWARFVPQDTPELVKKDADRLDYVIAVAHKA